jgi:hypothetical protein
MATPPEGSGPVSVFPPGLLSFFEIKNMGRNPSTLLDAIRPSMDLRKWYMQAKTEYAESSVSAGQVTGFTGFLQLQGAPVPDNEWWWLERYTVWAGGVAAADRVWFQPAYRIPSFGTLPTAFGDPVKSDSSAGVTRWTSSGEDIFIPPGSLLGTIVTGVVAAVSVQFVCNFRFVRLRS